MKISFKTLAAIFLSVGALSATGASRTIDFDKIKYWAGDPAGTNRAALVVQFNDTHDNRAFIWGYRWNGTASGEDMVRAVTAQSSSLLVLVQYTGSMGTTFDGAGISADRANLADYVEYDFEKAKTASAFDFYHANTMLGQADVPGDGAYDMVMDAKGLGATNGIIEHPINARRYGYPSYDYDCWQLSDADKADPRYRWQAGWYDGYWSYWCGTASGDVSYSGLGMSSRQLNDGDIDWWNFYPSMVIQEMPSLSDNIDYEFADMSEKMKTYEAPVYPVDFDRILSITGEGEKICSVVFKFNDGRDIDNLVYGYRWSGGWDDKVRTILKELSDSDSRLDVSLDEKGNVTAVSFDGDNKSGNWETYAYFTAEPECMKLHEWNYANPHAVIVVTLRGEEERNDLTLLPYRIYLPADGSHGYAIPDELTCTVSDAGATIPVYAQTESGTTTEWSTSADGYEISGDATAGHLTFLEPRAGDITVKVSSGTSDSGAAESILHITAPEMPATSISFRNSTMKGKEGDELENPVTMLPESATFTHCIFSSSDPEIVRIEDDRFIVGPEKGEATVSARYAWDPEISATFTVTANETSGIGMTGSASVRPANDGTIFINGHSGDTMHIYDMSGRIAASFLCQGDNETFRPRVGKGTYILSIGKTKLKIFVK